MTPSPSATLRTPSLTLELCLPPKYRCVCVAPGFAPGSGSRLSRLRGREGLVSCARRGARSAREGEQDARARQRLEDGVGVVGVVDDLDDRDRVGAPAPAPAPLGEELDRVAALARSRGRGEGAVWSEGGER